MFVKLLCIALNTNLRRDIDSFSYVYLLLLCQRVLLCKRKENVSANWLQVGSWDEIRALKVGCQMFDFPASYNEVTVKWMLSGMDKFEGVSRMN